MGAFGCARDVLPSGPGGSPDFAPAVDMTVRIPCGDAWCGSGQVCINYCCKPPAPCLPPACGTIAVPCDGPCNACVMYQNCCGMTDPRVGVCDITCFENFDNVIDGQAMCHCRP